MVIDMHQHPLFFKDLCASPEVVERRKEQQAYYKMGPQETRRAIEQNLVNGVDRAALLSHDFTSCGGDRIVNEDMAAFIGRHGDRFYGFAAVDPNRANAEEELERAFGELKLSGLTLHLVRQHMLPSDDRMMRLYEVCRRHNKPVIFHAGLSWQPNGWSRFGQPSDFEPVAMEFPDVRFSLSHFAFPWVTETAALLAKYPNMYADTSSLFFDSTDEMFAFMFDRVMDITWIDRGIRHQVMFGSDNTRWGVKRAVAAIKRLKLRPETIDLILGRNALEFLGEEDAKWLN